MADMDTSSVQLLLTLTIFKSFALDAQAILFKTLSFLYFSPFVTMGHRMAIGHQGVYKLNTCIARLC